MADHRHKGLQAAIQRRESAQQQVQRLQGRLEAARDAVASVEQECQRRGVDPDQLPSAIAQLESRYDEALADFEKDMKLTEGLLAPFREDSV